MLLGNGTFAMNNNDAIAYRMNFTVVDNTPVPVSAPPAAGLATTALLMLAWMRTRQGAVKAPARTGLKPASA